jgi:hypothetical protein
MFSIVHFVNVAPFQLSEEVLWIHSARLDEALVTAAVYLDARDLKSAATSKTTVEDCPSLPDGTANMVALPFELLRRLTFQFEKRSQLFIRTHNVIAENLSASGWSWGCVSAVDSCGGTSWIADAHRGD